ncbi:MAG: hypothetical protein JOZ05_01055 [Acetobacteraceae bacterium]|nr:hypothetical protein [Acetobacteraceae bacterium]
MICSGSPPSRYPCRSANHAEITAFSLRSAGSRPASGKGVHVNSIIYIVGLVVVVVAVLSFFGLR